VCIVAASLSCVKVEGAGAESLLAGRRVGDLWSGRTLE